MLQVSAASYTANGFWADHWTYTLDLVESFLAIYPDKEWSSLYDLQVPFFMAPAIVRDRIRRYVLVHSAGIG
jgi:hypothetical protein